MLWIVKNWKYLFICSTRESQLITSKSKATSTKKTKQVRPLILQQLQNSHIHWAFKFLDSLCLKCEWCSLQHEMVRYHLWRWFCFGKHNSFWTMEGSGQSESPPNFQKSFSHLQNAWRGQPALCCFAALFGHGGCPPTIHYAISLDPLWTIQACTALFNEQECLDSLQLCLHWQGLAE